MRQNESRPIASRYANYREILRNVTDIASFIHVQTELYEIPRISTHTTHTHTTPYKITKVAPLHSLAVFGPTKCVRK